MAALPTRRLYTLMFYSEESKFAITVDIRR